MHPHIWQIEHDQSIGSHLTHRLPATLTPKQITARLDTGPEPNGSGDGKVKRYWGVTIDGAPAAIWDYKGRRWSAYDPSGNLGKLFPELQKA